MSDTNRVSRREFLRILGSGSLFVFASLIGMGSVSSLLAHNSRSGLIPKASGATSGFWQLGPDTLSLAIHAALLHDNKVLYVSGSSDNPENATGPFKAGLLDLINMQQTEMILDEDIFCSGHCQLANGNILFAGGNLSYKQHTPDNKFRGLKSAYVYDLATQSFGKITSLQHGRWYPTLVTLPDGDIFTTSGSDEFGCTNDLTEIYSPQDESWTIKYNPNTNTMYCVGSCSSDPSAEGSPCYGGPGAGVNPRLSLYPRMHVLPNGLVAVCGQEKDLSTWNPASGEWFRSEQMLFGPRRYGTSVLLPLQNITKEKGQILLAGGAATSDSPAFKECEIVSSDGKRLNTRITTPMNRRRKYLNSIILPNGKVLIIGGTTQGNKKQNAVYSTESFDPVSEEWTILSFATVPRIYHSVALLLPDGRVWTASSTYTAMRGELRTEIFSPDYTFETRPTITGTPVVGLYGEKIRIPTKDSADIAAVSLIRISTVTHHFNTDQRLVWLQILNRGNFNIVVRAPLNARLAPPGYYLIHLVNSAGVPSIGEYVKIS